MVTLHSPKVCDDLKTGKMSLEKLPFIVRHLPAYYVTAATHNGLELQFVPMALRNYLLCCAAVQNTADALAFVPPSCITFDLCYIALKQDPDALRFLSDEQKLSVLTPEMYQYIMENKGDLWLDNEDSFWAQIRHRYATDEQFEVIWNPWQEYGSIVTQGKM